MGGTRNLEQKKGLPCPGHANHIHEYQYRDQSGDGALLFTAAMTNSRHTQTNVGKQGKDLGGQPAVDKGVLLDTYRQGNAGD